MACEGWHTGSGSSADGLRRAGASRWVSVDGMRSEVESERWSPAWARWAWRALWSCSAWLPARRPNRVTLPPTWSTSRWATPTAAATGCPTPQVHVTARPSTATRFESSSPPSSVRSPTSAAQERGHATSTRPRTAPTPASWMPCRRIPTSSPSPSAVTTWGSPTSSPIAPPMATVGTLMAVRACRT